MKRNSKKKTIKLDGFLKTKSEGENRAGVRLQQPIQTALYAKLWRLGFET
jgi:hypothetical protein